jgi:hypothetical protein
MIWRSHLIVVAVAAVLAAVGCQSTLEPSEAVRLELSDTTFIRAGLSATVPFTLANRSDQAVLVPRCGDALTVAVERWNGNEWIAYLSGICPAIYPMAPATLEKGSDRASVVSVSEPARFRLVVALVDPPQRVVSRSFVIR